MRDIDILDAGSIRAVLCRAMIPEHSVPFMQIMSGGRAFFEQGFLFFTAEDWLMGIGYPLAENTRPFGDENGKGPETCRREATAGSFHDLLAAYDAARFASALDAAVARTGAAACWAIAPQLPQALEGHIESRDLLYVLPADAPVPSGLKGPVAAAAKALRVNEDRDFSPAHRRLWAEFLGRVNMRPNVRELYARTEFALAQCRRDLSNSAAPGGEAGGLPDPGAGADRPGREAAPQADLRLLNAWDSDGNLAASLLLDYSPKAFCSYIIGAHSKNHYSPHATDLLFATMLQRAKEEGKSWLHLGLGVNAGIARFKRKWGARELLPYAMAAWQPAAGKKNRATQAVDRRDVDTVMRALLSAPPDMSKRQIFESLPRQREFAMVLEVRKGDALSYLCGSAHFFCYSFDLSFRRLFEPLETVIFEGPLDEDFLAAVEASGRNPEPGGPRAGDELTPGDVRRLQRLIYGPEGFMPRLLGRERPRRVDVDQLLHHTRSWFGFFSLWTAFLESLGWDQSVDLEAWRVAKDMGKAVIAMENLEEQLDSLESVPLHRITAFLRRCDEWKRFTRRNIQSYLAGDLRRMMGSSIEFPSRTERVIDRRDERFRQRMRPFLEAGSCAVFVGTAHLVGLVPMLREDGFSIGPYYPGLGLRVRAMLRRALGGGRAPGPQGPMLP
ncbi:TraB/GumN family protein [Desulfovibrio sp. OttesenSCG-928-A18]|nr:TraB/GumN family protein [Desulfovibrio sp. OttesenSCG-928-A18]